MTGRPIIAIAALLLLAGLFGRYSSAQQDAGFADAATSREAIERALSERDAAEARALRLEQAADLARESADRAARQSAAIAARIQQSEASIAAAEAQLDLIETRRRRLAARLAERQQPVVRLTAALQRFSRRPLALSVMRPGSVKEMVFMRALLSSTVPEVQSRTTALRGEIDRVERLALEANQARDALRGSETELEIRQQELADLATRQRIASREASGEAGREAERALSLAEEARDLDALVGRLDEVGDRRNMLAALPGPIIRPPRPSESQVVTNLGPSASARQSAPSGYQLPVTGQTVIGFGSPTESGVTSKGLTLSPRQGAQVVAPAQGRVAFAGPYRGYGQIIIIEHAGGWTSLVTGLARVDVNVGDDVLGGAPLGIAPQREPGITLELRRAGEPVNPLEFLG